jgi:integrase
MVSKAFYNAIKETNLDLDKLNITFHSWRHTFNSQMCGKIPDSKLQRLSDHKTIKMIEPYPHYKTEDYIDVIKAQNNLLQAS